MPDEPRVVVTADGPYEVHGVPLVRTAQVETEYGEPVDWAPDDPLPSRGVPRLCRCGRSSTKPFCDDSHEIDGFDGTEVADRGRYDDRAATFPAHGFTLHDDLPLCTDAGYCGDRFEHVWDMLDRTTDPQVAARVRAMVRRCPSGRIVTRDPDGTADELAYPPSVAVVADGPLWVRGGVPVVAADGEPYEVRPRQTLCRCGHSENKPFCDGSHKVVGFTDA
ncbi:MAG TPA: CDGSH iron-sulfur domain-containing protein [Actinomycetota bacterium]|nr:CDGSH iron-sulfur domain-containing protein [Actinomycetota bacterium]